jgi:putative CocE/NonD family hydrolase
VRAQDPPAKEWVKAHYQKREVMVPMRDGVKLFTAIYSPKDDVSAHPILMRRTPYSCSPYGPDEFPDMVGPSTLFQDKGYVFVVQDVRGAYMSEGTFVDMRPHNDEKKAPTDVDESSDTWDTIDWLVKNVEHNNGRVGTWGISYPGFYASAGMIDAHPALKAVSPQAPIADWWYDDFHHHGALFLPHAFNFLGSFGQPRPEPTTKRSFKTDLGTPDGYRFFLDLGPMFNVDANWYHGKVAMWNDIVAHPDYDAYWRHKNLLPHLKHVAPAVMTVGGWFDAEDLYGALQTYRAIERQNPGIWNVLVMGPWQHGGWSRTDGDKLGNARFGAKTSLHYRSDMELAFFEHFLRDADVPLPSEANVFDTGANEWRTFDAWPPKEAQPSGFAFGPARSGGYDEFVSDPAHPVPYTQAVTTGMTREYMTDDQRFVATRPDVLVYRSKMQGDVTIAGPVDVHLKISTSATDGDWIVKLIDEFPPDAPDPKDADALPAGEHMGGYQMMVRSEVVRGRYRNDPADPKPFVPGEVTQVDVPLQDVLHTFKKGHCLMVQVQCTWFPLVDRNPQTFVPGVSIYQTREDAFVKATQRVWNGSRLEYKIIPSASTVPAASTIPTPK